MLLQAPQLQPQGAWIIMSTVDARWCCHLNFQSTSSTIKNVVVVGFLLTLVAVVKVENVTIIEALCPLFCVVMLFSAKRKFEISVLFFNSMFSLPR